MISTANCPACGAPITFRLGSSIVVICEFCNSAIARTDRDVRNLGKVADLMDTQSGLSLGTEGRFDNRHFTLTGRAQHAHSAGGAWDEWFATFDNGDTGWLAEAQGRFTMTFPRAVPPGTTLPELHGLKPGMAGPLPGGGGDFVVNEVGSARSMSAKGEIPYPLVPGQDFWFADLSGQNGAFATIDFSDTPPSLYVGRETTLAEMGIRVDRDTFGAEERRVGAARLTCPNCGGPMELRTPESERATCPSCNALLDVNQGNLTYLKTLEFRGNSVVPLGTEAAFDEGRMMVIGFVTRYVVVDGTKYGWDEHLLYSPEIGFRWLVHDTGHWSYVTPVSPGDVFDGGVSASFHNKTFKQFQGSTAWVESVFGEFYWRVEVGEAVFAKDFVCPPEILSSETSATEVNWSRGLYKSRDEIASIFNIPVDNLPSPSTVGMAQPNPHNGKAMPWFVLLLVALIVGIVIQFMGAHRRVFDKSYTLPPLDSATGTQVVFSDPVDLSARQNIKVVMGSPVDNTWAYVEGDFVNEETGLVQNFTIPVEYYHGVEDGESWSEGSQSAETHISALPAGKYTIRLEAQWEKWQEPLPLTISIEQGVPRVIYLVLVLALIAAGWILRIIIRASFESRRWAESMFTTTD